MVLIKLLLLLLLLLMLVIVDGSPTEEDCSTSTEGFDWSILEGPVVCDFSVSVDLLVSSSSLFLSLSVVCRLSLLSCSWNEVFWYSSAELVLFSLCVESIEPLRRLSSVLRRSVSFRFSCSCILNFSKASSMKVSGTFLFHTFILPMYSTCEWD